MGGSPGQHWGSSTTPRLWLALSIHRRLERPLPCRAPFPANPSKLGTVSCPFPVSFPVHRVRGGGRRFLPQATGRWGEMAFARNPSEIERQRLGLGCGVEIGRPWSCQAPTLHYDLISYLKA